MKIQDMAIIFVIIILPISLALSVFTQFQIQTLNTQTLYDSQLTAATYDAIKAYQINAENETHDSKDLKSSQIEAAVSLFKNSIMSSFRLNGYTEEELDNYIPALVYTMYDGFYIYSPYENTNYQYQPITDAEGNVTGYDESIPLQNNGDTIYGLKPYINYSCRYVNGDIDVVITYALENYITVHGMIGNEYVNKSGYLIDGIAVNSVTGEVKYNEVTIPTETLKEYLPIPRATDNIIPDSYPYVKLNGTKYYRVDINSNIPGDDSIIYLSNGTIQVQCEIGNPDYTYYNELIENNDSAIKYYKKAQEFTNWVKDSGLQYLKYQHAYENGTQIWGDNETLIFDSTINIENELSNFNQHRLAVIRHKIESNLAIAIANYNNFSGATNDFQMPKLKEDEWDYIINNISLISFLQGLPIGGKTYNGYTIVTNSESEEVVLEENIYLVGHDKNDEDDCAYHSIGDIVLKEESVEIDDNTYGEEVSSGRLNLDFRNKKISNNNNQLMYYYPLQQYNASYTSIVTKNNVTPYEDIYKYVNEELKDEYKTAYYTALGREREGKFNSNIIMKVTPYIPDTYEPTYDDVPIDEGFVIEDENGNQFTWVEVPQTVEVYATTGLNVTEFTDETFAKIEHDLKVYTSEYAKDGYVDEWDNEVEEELGLTKIQYYNQKRKMLKSIYLNGGFYVGRYETGTTTDRTSSTAPLTTAVIQVNKYPYNYVDVKQAQELSKGFTSGSTEYTSSLMFGVQWDLILKYLESKGTPQNELKENSKNWGNLKGSSYTITDSNVMYSTDNGLTWANATSLNKSADNELMLTTGASGTFSKRNISDLAGNLYEWTLERKSKQAVERGNYYGYSNVKYAASVRGVEEDNSDESKYWRGFRVSLYRDEGGALNTYDITYNALGGSGAPSKQTVIHGDDITVSSTKPNKDGHTFLGWDTSSSATTVIYNYYDDDKKIISNITANMTLYAVWQANEYTITYSAPDATGIPSSQTVTYGENITVSSTKPSKDGYIFLGWDTSPSATTVIYNYDDDDKKTISNVTGDMTLYAVWEEEATYKIWYHLGGGSIAGTANTLFEDPTVYYYEDTVTVDLIHEVDDELTRSGYTFAGWKNSIDGEIYQYGDTFTCTGNATLTAIWNEEIPTYSITYIGNGGKVIVGEYRFDSTSVEVYEGEDSTVLTAERSGYTFLGWDTSSSATTVIYNYYDDDKKIISNVTGDMTLYAVWEEEATYKIWYHLGGGSIAGTANTLFEDPTVYYYEDTVTVDLIHEVDDELTRSGYTFAGWKNSIDGEIYQYGDTFTCTGNATLTAIWNEEIPTYSITYIGNGGKVIVGEYRFDSTSVEVYEGEDSTVLTAERSGYTFLGWDTSSSATTVVYNYDDDNKKTISNVTGNITLYAVWQVEESSTTYTITYNIGTMSYSGITAPEPDTVEAGQSVTLPTITTTIGYYKFEGWSTSSSYGAAVDYKAGTEYTPTADITLYAVWGYDTWTDTDTTTTYTITYNTNGGTGIFSSQSVVAGESVTLSSTSPFRTGYKFLGWNRSSTATVKEYSAGQTITPTGSMTLYAVWEKISSSITPVIPGTEVETM